MILYIINDFGLTDMLATWPIDSNLFLSLDGGEIPTVCEHVNGPDTNMRWYTPAGMQVLFCNITVEISVGDIFL